MWAPLLGGVLAGAGYLLGTGLHELSHVAAVLATGSSLERVSLRHTAVEYAPTSEYADWLVKATPTLLAPALAGAVVLSVSGIWEVAFGLGLLAGFIPRDTTEYVAVGQLLVTGNQT